MKSRRIESAGSDVSVEPQTTDTELLEEGEASGVFAFAGVEQRAWEPYFMFLVVGGGAALFDILT